MIKFSPMVAATNKPFHQAIKLADKAEIANGDVLTIHHNKTWEQFKHLQKCFEDSSGTRLSYYQGIIEILMPGTAHELFKSVLGFLIETFLFYRRIEFEPNGSATQETADSAAIEPDESYKIQGLKLAVEVNFTSGSIAKLKLYKALGVNEVWVWEDGVLEVYHLERNDYRKVNRSQIPALSKLNLAVLSECILIGETSRIEAGQKLLTAHLD